MIVTRKELDETDKMILRLSAEGKAIKEIAAHLHLSIPTIKYRRSVMKKEFKCSNIANLVYTTRELY